MRLEVSRQKRVARPGDAPSYVIAARLNVSGSERRDIESHGLVEYELDLDENDEEGEVVPVSQLVDGREFSFQTAHEASDFEERLVASASEFAQLLIDSLVFGGRDTYELPLEDLDEDEEADG